MAGGGLSPVKPAASGPGAPVGYGSTGQPQYSYARKAPRPPAPVSSGYGYGSHTHGPSRHGGGSRHSGTHNHPMEKGVFQPKPAPTPPKTYQGQGFSGRRMGAPGTPRAPAGTSGSGIKNCSPCREVAKAVREVNKWEPSTIPHQGQKLHTHSADVNNPKYHTHAPDKVHPARRAVNKVVATPGGVTKRESMGGHTAEYRRAGRRGK